MPTNSQFSSLYKENYNFQFTNWLRILNQIVHIKCFSIVCIIYCCFCNSTFQSVTCGKVIGIYPTAISQKHSLCSRQKSFNVISANESDFPKNNLTTCIYRLSLLILFLDTCAFWSIVELLTTCDIQNGDISVQESIPSWQGQQKNMVFTITAMCRLSIVR